MRHNERGFTRHRLHLQRETSCQRVCPCGHRLRSCSFLCSSVSRQADAALHPSLAGDNSAQSFAGKSLEELAVENLSLRHSLDVLSLQAQALEQELDTYKRQADQRQEMMKSVVLGVKREAQKALIHSQILGSVYNDGPDKENDRSSIGSSRMSSPLRRMGHLDLDNGGSSPERRTKMPIISLEEDPFEMDSNHEDESHQTIRGVLDVGEGG